MLYTVFAVYDTAVSAWKPPFFGIKKGDVLREFADAVVNPQSYLGKHPADYSLFELGSWDDDKNSFDLHKAPIRLCMAMDFVKIAPAGGAGGLGAGPQERSEATGARLLGSK